MRMRGLPATLAVLVALSASAGRAETAPPPRGGPAPNFALTTQQSDRLWLAQLRGRAVVLAFGCTACGACPGLVERLAEVAGGLGDAPGRLVLFALVTVDPARDTPAALRQFGRARGLRAPAWVLLTEERAGEVDAVARRYGVQIHRTEGRIEADCVATLVDSSGEIRARYLPASLAALPHDLRTLLGLRVMP